MNEYQEFLKSKERKPIAAGFEVSEQQLNSNLFDFQCYIVGKALRMGRYAIFADCGLGKTLMQLEWAHQVSEYTGKPVLILCPLAVAGQTIQEGQKFGIKVEKYHNNEQLKGVYILTKALSSRTSQANISMPLLRNSKKHLTNSVALLHQALMISTR